MHAGRRFLSLSLVPSLQPGRLQGVIATRMEPGTSPRGLSLAWSARTTPSPLGEKELGGEHRETGRKARRSEREETPYAHPE